MHVGEEFRTLIDDLENNGADFKKWYDQEKPETGEELPMKYQKLTSFQLLLILRIFRADRIINGIKRFIIEYFSNQHYVQPPTLNFEKIF